MVWRTLQEWNNRGMVVIKGSKCLLRDPENNCLFNRKQVVKRKIHNNNYNYLHTDGFGLMGDHQKDDYDYDNWDSQ